MLFEIQRACPRPGQSRVIASGPSAIKTLERLTTLLPDEIESDDDDIMHDPDIQEMVENGEHTCHIFDAPCQACEDDEDDITLAELKEQLEDNMTLAELRDRLLDEEEEEPPIEWVDEMTFYSRMSGELRSF